jgi:Flp pilus assembly protein TadD
MSDFQWQPIVCIALFGLIFCGSCVEGAFAAKEVSVSLSPAIDSKGIGIAGGRVTFFNTGVNEYGVRIDRIDFVGEWCSLQIHEVNRHSYYEIELWKDDYIENTLGPTGLIGPISKQEEESKIITGKMCDPIRVSISCSGLNDFTTNFKILQSGRFRIKLKMHQNEYDSAWCISETAIIGAKTSDEATGTESNEGPRVSQETSDVHPNIEELIDSGYNFFKQDRYSEALACYDDALDLDPNSILALNSRGWTLQTMDRYQDAIDCYENVIKLEPNNYYAWINKGGTYFDWGKYQEALIYYEKAIEQDPSNTWGWRCKGAALTKLNRYNDANKAYAQANNLDPNYAPKYSLYWPKISYLPRLGHEK